MANLPTHPDSKSDTMDNAGLRPGRGSTIIYPGTPRWVKMFAIGALIVVLLVVIVMFIGGGGHGPGRHIPSGGAGDPTPPIAYGVDRP